MGTDSELRQERISALRLEVLLKRQANEEIELLGSLSGVSFINFVEGDEHIPNPSHFWREIVGIEAIPDTKISNHSTVTEIENWLDHLSERIATNNECLVSFGRYKLPWARILITNSRMWLHEMWLSQPIREFIVFDSRASLGLGFTEEEHWYYGFIFHK